MAYDSRAQFKTLWLCIMLWNTSSQLDSDEYAPGGPVNYENSVYWFPTFAVAQNGFTI